MRTSTTVGDRVGGLTHEKRLVFVFTAEVGADIRMRVVDDCDGVAASKASVHCKGVRDGEGVAICSRARVDIGLAAIQLALDVDAVVHGAIGENKAATLLGVRAAGVGVNALQIFVIERVHIGLTTTSVCFSP